MVSGKWTIYVLAGLDLISKVYKLVSGFYRIEVEHNEQLLENSGWLVTKIAAVTAVYN